MKTKHPTDNRKPDAGPPPDMGCNETLILRRLLAESLLRLRAGRAVERDHGVIHPELTSIIRDVERLARRLNSLSGQPEAADAGELKNMLTNL